MLINCFAFLEWLEASHLTLFKGHPLNLANKAMKGIIVFFSYGNIEMVLEGLK